MAVRCAVQHLHSGDVLALPTETVYGLAADALNVDAALKIFAAKERPRFDPLIVHLPDVDWLQKLTRIASAEEKLVSALIAEFWPGPLTLVLPRQPLVSDVVTAGLETVAIRLSAHPVFAAVIRAFGRPLAAPSANRFGRISPTRAQDVAAELDGRIPLIVDGGATEHGLESTIVALRDGALEILRPGPITADTLGTFAEVRIASVRTRSEAPGQFASHYAPRTPLVLTPSLELFHLPPGRIGALSFRSSKGVGFADGRTLSLSGDLHEAAANLFRYLRELDESKLDLIVAEEMPDSGLGSAIMDRLRRAATRPQLRCVRQA